MFNAPFSFNGRIRRLEYGISYIMFWIIYGLLSIVVDQDEDSIYNIFGLGAVPLVWFFWAQGAKRCHDLGNNGWYQIIPFYFLFLIFQQGTQGENEYGNDPRDPHQEHHYVRPEITNNPDEND